LRAEDLEQSEPGRACLEALRSVTAQTGGPMERHCLRTFLIAERLAGEEPFDRDVLLCAAWLHDAGLWRSSAHAYVTEGARLAAETLAPFGWPRERVQRCMDACEQHHAPTSRADLGVEVELIRLADQVEVSGGLRRHGIPRAWLRRLFRDVPRAGFAPMIARALAHEVRHRPGTIGRVFVRPRRTPAGGS
jgi:hypothetical protein